MAHLSIAIGDTSLAYQCLRLALAANNNHAEAFNNLAVIELRRGNVDQVRGNDCDDVWSSSAHFPFLFLL